MIWCLNDDIKKTREKFIKDVIDIIPEISKLNEKNIIKYCLLMSDSNLHLITATYIKDILNTYDVARNIEINEKYLKIFMWEMIKSNLQSKDIVYGRRGVFIWEVFWIVIKKMFVLILYCETLFMVNANNYFVNSSGWKYYILHITYTVMKTS